MNSQDFDISEIEISNADNSLDLSDIISEDEEINLSINSTNKKSVNSQSIKEEISEIDWNSQNNNLPQIKEEPIAENNMSEDFKNEKSSDTFTFQKKNSANKTNNEDSLSYLSDLEEIISDEEHTSWLISNQLTKDDISYSQYLSSQNSDISSK